jgi:hypothetical protein
MQADMTSAANGANTRALRQTAAVILERFPAADAAVDMIVMGFLPQGQKVKQISV